MDSNNLLFFLFSVNVLISIGVKYSFVKLSVIISPFYEHVSVTKLGNISFLQVGWEGEYIKSTDYNNRTGLHYNDRCV